jgi:hypothetical protein
MRRSVPDSLANVEPKPLRYGESRAQKVFVRGGELFEAAKGHCGYSQEQAADLMGITGGTLSKQIDNTDNQHLSFQRICEMPPAFRRELAMRMLMDVADGEPLRMFLEVPIVERKQA